MPYTRTPWANYCPPPLDAANLINMEDGIWYGLAHSGGIRNVAEFAERYPGSTTGGIQEAIDDVSQGTKMVIVPPGTYTPTVTINGRANTILWFAKGAVIDASGSALTPIIRALGTAGITTTLTADAAAGAQTIAVTNVAGFAVDDYVKLLDDSQIGGDQKGEIHRIQSIAGNNITFEEPLWDSYAVGDNALIQKLSLVDNFHIYNPTIIGSGAGNNQYGIHLEYCNNPVVETAHIEDCEDRAIALFDTLYPRIYNPLIVRSNLAGLGYGISLGWATQFAIIRDGKAIDCRHAVAMGGSPGRAGHVREPLVDVFSADDCVGPAFDAHPSVDGVVYRDCIARHPGHAGFNLRNARGSLENCKVINGGGAYAGMVLENASERDTEFSIIGGYIESSNEGIRIDEDSALPGHTAKSIIIKGVMMNVGAIGIRFRQLNAGVDIQTAVIEGNIIHQSANTVAIHPKQVKGGTITGNVIRGLGHNTNRAIYLEDCTKLTIGGNTVVNWDVDGDDGGEGVRLDASTTYCLVEGNNLKDTQDAVVNLGGPTNKISHNMNEVGAIEACVRAYHSGNQDALDSTWFALALDSEWFDTDGIHDNAVNNSRLTCQTAGKYQISGTVEFASDNTGIRILAIRLNGATYIGVEKHDAAGTGFDQMTISTLYELVLTDYVELMVWQSSGLGPPGLRIRRIANNSPEFMMAKVE